MKHLVFVTLSLIFGPVIQISAQISPQTNHGYFLQNKELYKLLCKKNPVTNDTAQVLKTPKSYSLGYCIRKNYSDSLPPTEQYYILRIGNHGIYHGYYFSADSGSTSFQSWGYSNHVRKKIRLTRECSGVSNQSSAATITIYMDRLKLLLGI